MYKKYNSKANSLSPLSFRQNDSGSGLSVFLERLTPLLILAASFIWLWK